MRIPEVDCQTSRKAAILAPLRFVLISHAIEIEKSYR